MADELPQYEIENVTGGQDTSVAIEDGQTASGLKAKVEAKASGENAVHVITELSSVASGAIPAVDNKLRFEDINATSGDGVGKARDATVGATFETIWKFTGDGLLFSWNMTLESPDQWSIRMIIDGVDIIVGATGVSITDIMNSSVYNLKSSNGVAYEFIGLYMESDTIFWNGPNGLPINYATSFEIQAIGNGKKFKAGFVELTEN